MSVWPCACDDFGACVCPEHSPACHCTCPGTTSLQASLDGMRPQNVHTRSTRTRRISSTRENTDRRVACGNSHGKTTRCLVHLKGCRVTKNLMPLLKVRTDSHDVLGCESGHWCEVKFKTFVRDVVSKGSSSVLMSASADSQESVARAPSVEHHQKSWQLFGWQAAAVKLNLLGAGVLRGYPVLDGRRALGEVHCMECFGCCCLRCVIHL